MPRPPTRQAGFRPRVLHCRRGYGDRGPLRGGDGRTRRSSARPRSRRGIFGASASPCRWAHPSSLKMEDGEQTARVTEVIESADPNVAGMRLRFGAATSTVTSAARTGADRPPVASAAPESREPPVELARRSRPKPRHAVAAEAAPPVAAEAVPGSPAEATPASGQAASASEPGDQGGHSRRRRRRR